MSIKAFPFLTFALLLVMFSSLSGQKPAAVKGVIDLRQIQHPQKFYISLNGEWEFYWKKMLYPHNFDGPENPKPDLYGKVPSYWTEYSDSKIRPGNYGYATYHLTVLLPEKINKRLAFDVPVFDSSFDMWVNDSLLASNGQPGMSESETVPQYTPKFFRFTPVSDTLSIIINVSNFHHRRGGFWLPLNLGTFSEVQKKKANIWAGEYATASLVLGFGLFFLAFFLLHPKEKIMAFFSMVLIGLAFRPLFTSQFLIYDFFNLGWQWTVKLEYISLFIIMTGMAWFVDSLYPSRLIRIIAYIITFSQSLSCLITILFPVKVFSYCIFAYYGVVIIIPLYSLSMSFAGALKRRVIDIIYFGAFVLLTMGLIHDTMVSLGKSSGKTGYVMSFVIVIFIFIQAVLLLYKFIISFKEKDRLHNDLEFMNRNLEKLVNERTLELKTRNDEIEKQNNRIALQNKQLSESLQLKNKLFSVIAHDLRSPVVNILYMLNLLKEKEYKEKYDTFANSSIEYAQLVINLLENMLVWGRGQEDKIKYSPEKQDLANIILPNLSIFKESSDRKEISVNFTQIGNSVAWVDKDLMDIVIRNLLSNAVKYTNRGGRISILVKDRSNNGEGLLLKICDNGIGIPETVLNSFYSSSEIKSTPGTENEKGTGLGLKLCQELIRINMGTITIESKEGEGTCFIITLPDEKTHGSVQLSADRQAQ
jgi:signal transduction histidine kinase